MPDCGKINRLPSLTLADVGAVLHNVHVGMVSLVGELIKRVINYHWEQWLGHVDAKVASAVWSAKKGATRATVSAAVGVHVTAMCVKLAQLLGEGGAEQVKAAGMA